MWRGSFAGFVMFLLAGLAGCAQQPVSQKPAQQAPRTPIEQVSFSSPHETHQASFWRTQVTYPFPVSFASIEDVQQRQWTLAYSDRYQGLRPLAEAPVVVFVHGRGATMAAFERLMQECLEAGLRVIAFDLPHYGYSLPDNLHLPVSRTLAQSRELAYRLLSNHLGVQQAHFIGHSLGGQWVLGYGLAYPAHTASITAIASHGLEEFPQSVWRGDGKALPLFDPTLQTHWAQWLTVWGPLGHLRDEMQLSDNAIDVRYQPGAGQEAAFLAATRKAMRHGNPVEYQRFVETMVWDLYAMGVEVRHPDPDSLVKRLHRLQMPVLLLFGEQDRYLPVNRLSGHTRLVDDVIAPLHERMAAAGNTLHVVVYPGVGHVPHIEQASRVADDVIAFVYRQRPRSAELRLLVPESAHSSSGSSSRR